MKYTKKIYSGGGLSDEQKQIFHLGNLARQNVTRSQRRAKLNEEMQRLSGINVTPVKTREDRQAERRAEMERKREQYDEEAKRLYNLPELNILQKKTYKYLPLHTGRKTSPRKTHKKRVYSLPGNTQFANRLKPLLDKYLSSYNVEYNSAECKKPAASEPTASEPTATSRSVTTGITFKAQQRFVSDFISLHTPFTGIVLWHGLGSGKTLSAIAIGEKMISDVEMRQKIRMRKYNMMIVAPAMLEDNFRSELEKYDPYYKTHRILRGAPRNEVLYYKFSANGKLQTSVSKTMAEFEENIVRSVIIIDESQLVINSVTRTIMDRKKSALLSNYEKMLNEDTCRIVCLSGTPVVNWAVELAVLFNLLAKCPTVYNFQMNPLPSVISYSAFQTMFDKKHKHTLECIDYTRSYVDATSGLLCIVRNPLYFISTADGIVYDEHKNSYDNSKFTEDLIKMLGPMTDKAKKAPLFDINTFEETYGLELNNEIRPYDVTTTLDTQRTQDILENRTWRTASIKNAPDFAAKVAGYMSYFGNIDKLIPKVNLLKAELKANPELFRVGISNSGEPLFTVQRCEFSELGQRMFDTYSNLKEPVEIIGFMKRNITRVMYPFNSPEALLEWATVSVPQELEKHAEKLYNMVETSMYGNNLTSHRLLLVRMRYVYALLSMSVQYNANKFSSIRKQWTAQWSSEEIVEIQIQKRTSASAAPKKRIPKRSILPDESATINLTELIKNNEKEKRIAYVEKLFTNQTDRDMILHDLETEGQNYIYDKAVTYNLFASYYNILCDILTCTMAVRSIWERPNSQLPDCKYIDGTPRELIRAQFADYCPKIYQIIQRIINNPNKRHIIYSQYKQVNIPIARALMALGYDELEIKDTGGKLVFDPPIDPAKKRYMFVTGQGGDDDDYSHNLVSQFLSNSSEGNLEKSLKQHYIDIFNGDLNDERFSDIHSTMEELGENDICNVVILNSAAAEGITLKKVNFVHLLHPPPDMAKIYQIIGRAIRNCTHASLPESQQTVTAILYLLKLRNGEMSSDESKYNECVNEADKYVPYLNLLKGTAVDCEMNKKIITENGHIYPGLNCVISP